MKHQLKPEQLRLLEARKKYSKCAHSIESKIKECGLTETLSEQVIGVGVAADWLRRAAEMNDITFVGEQLNASEHKASFVELLRFTFSWFGLNAIFSRPALLDLIGKPNNNSEFGAFLVLFNAASISNSACQTAELQDLLKKTTAPRLPGLELKTSVSTLFAIQTKYLQHASAKGATAKHVADAAKTGNITALSLPTLLYAFRNWSVHGAALDGSFGSRPGFVRYVEILQNVMADVNNSTAEILAANI